MPEAILAYWVKVVTDHSARHRLTRRDLDDGVPRLFGCRRDPRHMDVGPGGRVARVVRHDQSRFRWCPRFEFESPDRAPQMRRVHSVAHASTMPDATARYQSSASPSGSPVATAWS